jgi:hypothetical protein
VRDSVPGTARLAVPGKRLVRDAVFMRKGSAILVVCIEMAYVDLLEIIAIICFSVDREGSAKKLFRYVA